MKCQEGAGILDANGKLTKPARDKFVEDVKKKLKALDTGFPVPCGKPLKPISLDIPLEDEALFPDFHKSYVGAYEAIANTLNAESNFAFLPLCDILAFGINLNLKVPQLSLPDLLAALIVPTPDFLLDFGVPVPDLPSIVAKFPSFNLPVVKIPPFDLPPIPSYDVPLPAFDFFAKFPLELPKLLADLALQIPSFAPKIPIDFLADICKLVQKALPPPAPLGSPDPSAVELSVVQVAGAQVLAEKTTECLSIAVVGSTLGVADAGLVGHMGAGYGYRPPPGGGEQKKLTPPEQIIKLAKGASGLSYVSTYIKSIVKNDKGKDEPMFTEVSTREKYLQFILPTDTPTFQQNTGKTLSSCGTFLRALLFHAGSKRDEITQPYETLTKTKSILAVLLDLGRELDKMIYDLSDGKSPEKKPTAEMFNIQPGEKAYAVLVGGSGQYEKDFGGTEHILLVTSRVENSDESLGIKRPGTPQGPAYIGIEGGQGTSAKGYGIGTALYGFYTDANGYGWATRWFRSDQKEIISYDSDSPGDVANQVTALPDSTKYAPAESRKIRAIIDLGGILAATK
jgi:hypothetical protein